MPLAFYRLGDKALACLVTSTFIALIIACNPIYQRWAYKNTIPAAYQKSVDHSGYPEGGGYTAVDSIKEIERIDDERRHDNFIIHVNAEDLEPLNAYSDICLDRYSTKRIYRVLNPDKDGGIGRFFIGTLKSGEKVVLFLDDQVLGLPKEGTIALPVGKKATDRTAVLSEIYERVNLDEGSKGWYVDMASAWREGADSRSMKKFQANLRLIVFFACIALEIVIYKLVMKKRKKN